VEEEDTEEEDIN